MSKSTKLRYKKESSIYKLLEEKKLTLKDMLVGRQGLGALLEKQGRAYGAVPSPTITKPVGCRAAIQ